MKLRPVKLRIRKCHRCGIWPATQGTICGHCFCRDLDRADNRARKRKSLIVYGLGRIAVPSSTEDRSNL